MAHNLDMTNGRANIAYLGSRNDVWHRLGQEMPEGADLNGVFIEPHTVGVTLTATDGRYLVCIHDETGKCEKPAIIKLEKHTLQSCKSARNEFEPRQLAVSDLGNAFVRYCGKDVGVDSKTIVEGTFPDWRRVVEQAIVPKAGNEHPPAFDQSVLHVLCIVARELGGDGKYDDLLIIGGLTGGPALVRFTDAPHAFGLVMPVRREPSWLKLRAETAIAA